MSGGAATGMSDTNAQQATRVVPLMRYRDLPNAITWLADAFGFEAHYTASDEDGKLIYAQMTYGHGMVMLGPVRDSDFDDLLSQPDEIGGTETQSCYLVVQDIEAHYQRAKEAGAEIALDVQSDETGGRAYSCRDCEGHLWNFGTFDPWQSTCAGSRALTTISERRPAGPLSMARSAAAVFAGLAIAGVAIGVYTHHQNPQDQLAKIRIAEPDETKHMTNAGEVTAPVRVVAALRTELKRERTDRREAEQRLALVQQELELEKSRSHDAVQATRRVSEELDAARGAERAALNTVERLRVQHIKDLNVVNASVEDLQKAIADERSAKQQALKTAEDLKSALVLERQRRQKAEQVAAAAAAADAAGNNPRRATSTRRGGNATGQAARALQATGSIGTQATAPQASPNGSGSTAKTKAKVKEQAVSAVETTAKGTSSSPASQTVKETAQPKPPATAKQKPRKRRRVVKKAPKKKPAAKSKRPYNALSRGWPHNTW